MKIFKANLILLVFAILGSCGGSIQIPSVMPPDDWQLIRAGDKFSFRAPANLQQKDVEGTDSFVGQYTSQTLELLFDYGIYSNPLNDDDYSGSWTIIDNRRAWIASKNGTMGVHFPKVYDSDENTGLTMEATLKGSSLETVHKIFRSIRFSKEPDSNRDQKIILERDD